jgi:UDP-N-acetylmuramyl pentapeptide phosphotransferase/UDP-N-acetylglucosamine-1-phosphate transferase
LPRRGFRYFKACILVFAIPHLALTAGGVASLVICLLIVWTKHLHGSHTLDSDAGIQKVHEEPTPRVGGVAILISAMIGAALTPPEVAQILWPMLIAALPAFFVGAIEDLFKRDRVRERMIATFASGVLAWWLTGVSLTRVGIPMLDSVLAIIPISVLFTAFALSGVANAINIIDGFNGLASGTVLLCLSALGLIAFQAADAEMAKICFVLAGSIFGFMLVNYPKGKIFLGDGGAYLLGFLLGWVAVLVAMRNPYHVSPWAPLLACGYPVLEVLFSMLRRRARTLELGGADRLHLHSLLWGRVARRWFSKAPATTQNAAVFPMILLFAAIPAALAVTFRTSTPLLIVSFVFCALLYALIYARLVHFHWTRPRLRPAQKSTISRGDDQ